MAKVKQIIEAIIWQIQSKKHTRVITLFNTKGALTEDNHNYVSLWQQYLNTSSPLVLHSSIYENTYFMIVSNIEWPL